MPLFHCPHCAQVIDASDDYIGMEADCPTCQATITVPQIENPGPSAQSSSPLKLKTILPLRSPHQRHAFSTEPPPAPKPVSLLAPRFQPTFPYQAGANGPGWYVPGLSPAPALPPLKRHSRHDYYGGADDPGREFDHRRTWWKRVAGMTLTCWLVGLAINVFALMGASYTPGGVVEGAFRYAIGQSVVLVLLCSVIAVSVAALCTVVGLIFRARAYCIWGMAHTGVLAILTVLNFAWQTAPKSWLADQQKIPLAVFFAPDPNAGEKFMNLPGIPVSWAQGALKLHTLCSPEVFPSPPNASDLVKFRWLLQDRIQPLEKHFLDDRRFIEQQMADVNLRDPEWFSNENNIDTFLDKLSALKERIQDHRNLCQKVIRGLPVRLEAVRFSRPMENSMQGHVGQVMMQHLSTYNRILQDELLLLDDMTEMVKYLRVWHPSVPGNGISTLVHPEEVSHVVAKLYISAHSLVEEKFYERETAAEDFGQVERWLADEPPTVSKR